MRKSRRDACLPSAPGMSNFCCLCFPSLVNIRFDETRGQEGYDETECVFYVGSWLGDPNSSPRGIARRGRRKAEISKKVHRASNQKQ